MKKKINYLNTLLTIIAIALTVIVLQNANIIQPVNANVSTPPVKVDIVGINGYGFFGMGVLPVEVQ